MEIAKQDMMVLGLENKITRNKKQLREKYSRLKGGNSELLKKSYEDDFRNEIKMRKDEEREIANLHTHLENMLHDSDITDEKIERIKFEDRKILQLLNELQNEISEIENLLSQ